MERSVFRARDAEGCICIVKNLNDGHCTIRRAEIILPSSLKWFRLDKIEVCSIISYHYARFSRAHAHLGSAAQS
jgi:hypothetical protein